jgi:hypothetical protein
MTEAEVSALLAGLMEELAAVEHVRWSAWQAHVHASAERRPDGSLVIPAAAVARWERQIAAPYAALDESEKESDRRQVRRYLPVIEAALRDAVRRGA